MAGLKSGVDRLVMAGPNGDESQQQPHQQSGVKQRDVPGIDVAYLAMDNETGNEVVWNEVQFSERKNFREKEPRLTEIFSDLTQLAHTNLVKFHTFWTDNKSEKPRIIFITEYMSSGSMSLFLQRTRKSGNTLSVKAWRKWVSQILSALAYLHSAKPPIIHGNLCCNTIFIQQNGLIKIGCVAPDAISHHVKTYHGDNLKSIHYLAPECDDSPLTTFSDIYAFGICALEIAKCGALCNGAESIVTPEMVEKALYSLEDDDQRELIADCLKKEPHFRPSAQKLLFHRTLFEIHALKLLAAHEIVGTRKFEDFSEGNFRVDDIEEVAAVCKLSRVTYSQVPNYQHDLEKFLDDVRNGNYPLITFTPIGHFPNRLSSHSASGIASTSAAASDTAGTSSASVRGEAETAPPASTERSPTPPQQPPAEPVKSEPRLIMHMTATIEGTQLSLLLQLDDSMNRQLTTLIQHNSDTAQSLTDNLISNGFICENDADKVIKLLSEAISTAFPPVSQPSNVSPPPSPSLPS